MKGLVVSSSPSFSTSLLFFSHHPSICSSSSSSSSSSYSSQFLQFRIPQQQQRINLCYSTSSSSSSSLSSVVEEQKDSPTVASPSLVESVDEVDNDTDALPLNFSGCKSCGRESIESGCNGEGRIQGGIATFPGFGWWPIKAYRPCPGFLESGGSYRRRGQSMDEVAFGGGKRGSSKDDSKTRKKGKNTRQSKG